MARTGHTAFVTFVPSDSSSAARKAHYEQEITYFREKIRTLEKFGEDLYENDTVLFFKRTFNGTEKEFTYAAIKAAGRWYLTGRDSGAYTWEQLVEDHLSEASEVWAAAVWERL